MKAPPPFLYLQFMTASASLSHIPVVYVFIVLVKKRSVFLYHMQYNMLLDFTRRVAQAQIPHDTTSDIYKCIQYIKQHTNQAISTSDVAAYIGKSRSHLSRCFKKELGFEMSEFIMRCKLEEAKSLLTYTDKSLSEISSYLCFSSQAYFQNVFKKKFGVTPNEYRRRPDVR